MKNFCNPDRRASGRTQRSVRELNLITEGRIMMFAQASRRKIGRLRRQGTMA
jgi:hypothetical protein